MSNILVAFLLGVGVAAWVYNKLMRSTGGNTQNSLVASGIVGFVAFVVMFIFMNIIT